MDNYNDTYGHTALRSAGRCAAAADTVFRELPTPTSIRPSPRRSPNGMGRSPNPDGSLTSVPTICACSRSTAGAATDGQCVGAGLH
jgi:hypothetical protein